VASALILGCAAIDATAQLQHGAVVVIVLDSQHQPIRDAQVDLADPLGATLQTVKTDAAGRARFGTVAPGRYEVRTAPVAGAPLHLPVNVAGAIPVEVTVLVPPALSDRVVVEATAVDDASSRGSIAGESIARVPVRIRTRGLQEVLATMPGWSTEDNGLLHTRGVDDGFLFVIDGVPVYERLDAVSGLTPDLASVAAINVVTGYVPPEFGYKAGGVIEVRSGTAQTWNGAVDVSAGSDAAREISGSVGGYLGSRLGVRIGGAAAASDRFLDPVHPDNLHNEGGLSSLTAQLEWAATGADRVSVSSGLGRSRFDVPNNEEQQDAGQDQRQLLRQSYVSASWQRTWSPEVITQAALYHRGSQSGLNGSVFDTPLQAESDRSLTRTGVLFSLTRQHRDHVIKTGTEFQYLRLREAFGFAITDEEDAEEAGFRDEALEFTRANPFRFRGSDTPTLFSAYVQDTWAALPRLTLSGGLRLDRSELLLTRTQVSPRVGAAYRFSDRALLRASVSHFFQPPQPENLLLSSSPEARVLSSITVGDDVGGADIEPERQWATELGLEHQVGRARVEVSYWARRMRNVADPNVFAGTTIIFPNSVAKGRAHGVEMRLELPQSRGWSGYANASIARVVQTGPINGGLFLEDEIEEIGPGVEFTPDHDQRFTTSGGLTWSDAGSGLAASVTARFETGTPVQREEDDLDELLERPGADTVDFESGRVKPRTVVSARLTVPVFSLTDVEASASLQALNLFNTRYAFNFGNPFSGTHFGAPRTFAISFRLAFR
jgi:outer membrane receptor protein involved in Fe transport